MLHKATPLPRRSCALLYQTDVRIVPLSCLPIKYNPIPVACLWAKLWLSATLCSHSSGVSQSRQSTDRACPHSEFRITIQSLASAVAALIVGPARRMIATGQYLTLLLSRFPSRCRAKQQDAAADHRAGYISCSLGISVSNARLIVICIALLISQFSICSIAWSMLKNKSGFYGSFFQPPQCFLNTGATRFICATLSMNSFKSSM